MFIGDPVGRGGGDGDWTGLDLLPHARSWYPMPRGVSASSGAEAMLGGMLERLGRAQWLAVLVA
jgi:hypothetical protein